MKKFLDWFTQEESGQGMVEYGLIIALVSIAVIAVLGLLGSELTNVFTKIKDKLAGAVPTP